jgi:hypothetical protein
MQRWHVVRHELIPGLRDDFDGLTPKLEKLIHTLEWVRIEEFAQSSWRGIGRPPHERAWLAAVSRRTGSCPRRPTLLACARCLRAQPIGGASA